MLINASSTKETPHQNTSRAAMVQEDVRRSSELALIPHKLQLEKQFVQFGRNKERWTNWLNSQSDIAHFTITNHFEWSRMSNHDIRRSQLMPLHSEQPFRYTAYIRIPVLEKIITNSRNNARITDVPVPKGPHIRSVPAEQANHEWARHKRHQQKSHFHHMQAVVKFKQRPNALQLQKIATELGARPIKQWQNIFVFESMKSSVEQMTAYFRKYGVDYVEAHFIYSTNKTAVRPIQPNDLLYAPYQWNLPLIQAEKAWKMGKGNGKVKVAVIDTGIDLAHPDLQGHLLPGYNAVASGEEPYDDVGHGTHVAGIIAARINNFEGIAGLSWFNPLIPIKVLDETGSGQSFAVADGIIWATDNGAKVINLSLGNYARSQFLLDAVRYAYSRDVVLIAAGGNESTDQLSYPAAFPEVLAVAAVDEKKNRAPFSNYGPYIDVAAPGVHIASTFPGDSYAALSGTSMAAPHVAALAALMRSACPTMKNRQVMSIIKTTASDIGAKGPDALTGYGLINVEKAMRTARKACVAVQQKTNPIIKPDHPLHIHFLQYLHNIKNPLR
jgi:type VII secretion-associated serine protease mycosin